LISYENVHPFTPRGELYLLFKKWRGNRGASPLRIISIQGDKVTSHLGPHFAPRGEIKN
jgi:hypothetical protein